MILLDFQKYLGKLFKADVCEMLLIKCKTTWASSFSPLHDELKKDRTVLQKKIDACIFFKEMGPFLKRNGTVP